MRSQQMYIKQYETIAITDFHGSQVPNQHGEVTITALIDRKKELEYTKKAEHNMWVEIAVVDDEGNESIFFSGVLVSMTIKSNQHECIMTLNLATGTILLEEETHLRSFQDSKITFEDVINVCNENYNDADKIMYIGKATVLPHFIMQYNISDWQFLKRICALCGGFIVPSCVSGGIKYFFGLPKRSEKVNFDKSSYTIINDKTISYAVESRDIYYIGSKVEFMNDTYVIWKVESTIKHSELCHTYYFSKNTNWIVRSVNCYDKDITGASLYGQVLEVKDEKVKVAITIDENNNSCSRWFPFSTVYSSSDGAGWYCMPEIGDKIRMFFPTSNESEAYVCSAVHKNKGDGIRTNPNNKIWRNKEGKEIRLTPDSILLTNNKGNSVELSDAQGIRITSNGSVNLKAGGRIHISSENSGIEIAASSRIRIQQGDSELLLQDGVQITGAKVNIM